MEKPVKKILRCPGCGKKGEWFSLPSFPFCSERCRLIDLGKWLDEEYCISHPLPADELSDEV